MKPDPTTTGTAGFLKLNRGDTTLELLKDSKAFSLLALIAYRARRSDAFSVNGLSAGEALIGDFRSCGLTPKSYREAKERLTKWQFAAFKGTNKGTIARLIDSRVFDINTTTRGEPEDTRGANEGQTRGKQGATNKNERRGRRVKNEESPHTPQGADGAVIDSSSFRGTIS